MLEQLRQRRDGPLVINITTKWRSYWTMYCRSVPMCTFQEDGNERLARRQPGRLLSLISVDPETHQITTKCFTDWRSGTDSKVSSFCRGERKQCAGSSLSGWPWCR